METASTILVHLEFTLTLQTMLIKFLRLHSSFPDSTKYLKFKATASLKTFATFTAYEVWKRSVNVNLKFYLPLTHLAKI